MVLQTVWVDLGKPPQEKGKEGHHMSTLAVTVGNAITSLSTRVKVFAETPPACELATTPMEIELYRNGVLTAALFALQEIASLQRTVTLAILEERGA